MPKVNVYNMLGETVGELELNEAIFSQINCLCISFSMVTIIAVHKFILKWDKIIFCAALAR